MSLKNPKHEAFCREVAGGLSLEQAWIAIGNNPSHRNMGRLARQPKIQARIAALREEFNRSSGLALQYLQEKLIPIATSDVTRYFEQGPSGGLKLKDVTELPPELRGALSELTISGDGKIKIKLWDKLHAVDSLIKTMGGFAPERVLMNSGVGDEATRKLSDGDPQELMRQGAFGLVVAVRELLRTDNKYVLGYLVEAVRKIISSKEVQEALGAAPLILESLPAVESGVEASSLDRVRPVLLAAANAAEAYKDDRTVAPWFALHLRQIADAIDPGGAS